jgi:hypothetical protein
LTFVSGVDRNQSNAIEAIRGSGDLLSLMPITRQLNRFASHG